MKHKLTWVRKLGRHENGDSLYLGRWKVGSVDWSCFSRSGPNYEIRCSLPGFNEFLPGDDDKDIAMKNLERAVELWLSFLDGEPE